MRGGVLKDSKLAKRKARRHAGKSSVKPSKSTAAGSKKNDNCSHANRSRSDVKNEARVGKDTALPQPKTVSKPQVPNSSKRGECEYTKMYTMYEYALLIIHA